MTSTNLTDNPGIAIEEEVISGKTFKFYVFHPDDEHGKDNYPAKVNVSEALIASEQQPSWDDRWKIKEAPAPKNWEFDACLEYYAIRHGNKRSHRRNHILCLGAKGLKRNVILVNPMPNAEDSSKLENEVAMLLTLVHGTRFRFGSSRKVYYRMNESLYEVFMEHLEEMGRRTVQISELDDYMELLPTFGSDEFPINYYYSKNDWEILAATFKCEVESYMKILMNFGYDFLPCEAIEMNEDVIERNETDPEAIPDSYVTKTPRKVSDMIQSIASGRKTGRDLFAELKDNLSSTSADNEEVISRMSRHSIRATPVFSHRAGSAEPDNQDEAAIVGDPDHTHQSALLSSRVEFEEPPYYPDSPTPSRPRQSNQPNTPRRSQTERVQSTGHEKRQTKSFYGVDTTPAISYGPEYESNVLNDIMAPSQFNQASSTIKVSNQDRRPVSGAGGAPGDPDDDPDDENEGGNDDHPRRGNLSNGRGGRRPDRGNPPNNGVDQGGSNVPAGNESVTNEANEASSLRRPKIIRTAVNKTIDPLEIHFDTKLKPDVIPTWDGDDEKLGKWLIKINEIAARSNSVFKGLGDVVPMRLTGKASEWWYSLNKSDRNASTLNWDTLKQRISDYWMNQAWVNKMQSRALRARFREPGHGDESPSQYYIRKSELIGIVYQFTDKQVIHELLKTAPATWQGVLQPATIQTLSQLQNAIKFYEENLDRIVEQFEPRYRKRVESKSAQSQSGDRRRTYQAEATQSNKPTTSRFTPKKQNSSFKRSNSSRALAIGWSGTKPQYPKDDSNVSRGRTPEDMGARPCTYCGSRKHWDRDCKHFQKGKSRAFLTNANVDVLMSEVEYQEAFLASRDEEESDKYEEESLEKFEDEATEEDEDLIESVDNYEYESDF